MAIFTGQTGKDIFNGTSAVADRFLFTSAALSSTDIVTGGLGTVNDSFEITAAGAITASQLAGVSGMEVVKMFAGSSIELNDVFVGSSRTGTVSIIGSAGNDTVFGGDISDISHRLNFIAGGGNDTFIGGAGIDNVRIGSTELSNRDFFSGGGGSDALTIATSGEVASSAFANVFGFERINLNDGGNSIALGQGTVGSTANGVITVTGGNGGDLVDASNVVSGRVVFSAGEGANTFLGSAGRDTVTAGDGNDILYGNNGNDVLDGGWGNNTIDGGTGNDVITCGVGNSTISGGAGNDVITCASDGENLISGGAGKDTITTYSQDVFVDTVSYAAPSEGGDIIKGDLSLLKGYEFAFQFDTAGFNTLGSNFDTVVFDDGNNSGAADGADLVFYNDGTGAGLGSAGAVDQYFVDHYFASLSSGAFLVDYNSDTFAATLYYDSSAFNSGGVSVIMTMQGLGANGNGASALVFLSELFAFA